MFDIFEQKEQPKLYIADVHVECEVKKELKTRVSRETFTIKKDNVPIVLLNNEFPTEKSKRIFVTKLLEEKTNVKSTSQIIIKSVEMKNIKFSSSLAYKFDYNTQ